MKGKGNAIIALLGLGALAWWKYKKSTPEEQEAVKEKFNTAKENLNKWGSDAKAKAEELADKAKSKAEELASKTQEKAEELADKAKTEASKVEAKVENKLS